MYCTTKTVLKENGGSEVNIFDDSDCGHTST